MSRPALNRRPLINTPLQRGDLELAAAWNPALSGVSTAGEKPLKRFGSFERLGTPLKRGVNKKGCNRILKSGIIRVNENMLIVHVHVHVRPESIEEFRQATVANARESVKEAGVARFEVLQQQDDPARFLLVEAYRTPEAPAAHKQTRHYQTWRDAVAPMMAEPRSSVKFGNVFPDAL